MNTFKATTAILLALTTATQASAQGMGGDFYASVFGGYSIGDTTVSGTNGGTEFDVDFEAESGYVVGVTVGTTIAPNIRVEAEVSYAAYSVDTIAVSYTGGSYSVNVSDNDVETTATYLLANVWYDVPNVGGASGATPYVGGGLGYGMLTGEADDGGTVDLFDDANGLAFQIGGGVQFPVGPGMIDVGYRYKAITGADSGNFPLIGGVDEASSATSSFQAGYVFKF